MGSNFNLKNFGNNPPAGGNCGVRLPGNFPLTRQSSVYSLTFEEFQSTLGGLGNDFGSMNMDELLKNIWSAEENGSTSGAGGGQEGGVLQRQGSLTLPRTISQKTVDEVWRDMSKEYSGAKHENGGVSGLNIPQRQQTLGEITLEEFLLKAGVVREDAQFAGKQPTNIGVFDDGNNSGLGFLYQQANMIPESGNQVAMQSLNGIRSAAVAQQIENQNQTMKQELLQNQAYRNQISMQSVKASGQQRHELLPKQPVLPYGAISNGGQLSSPGTRGGIVGNGDQVMTNNFVPNGGGLGVVGLGTGRGGVSVATGSPAFSSDRLSKSNGDVTSISPVPYVFSGGLRGRKGAALEKVVERRQRRMIKNRESAARSRARKQAYTMELEAEISKLKEENQGLQNKQAEIMEMQKNQVLETLKQQNGAKRRCLRRTQTGPW